MPGWQLCHNYDSEIPSGQDGKIASELSVGLSRGWERPLNPHRLLDSDVRDVERCPEGYRHAKQKGALEGAF